MSDDKDPLDKGPVFELKLMGRLNPAKLRPPPAEDSAIQSRRNDREKGRQLCADYATEAILTLVSLMRQDPDPNIKMRAAKMILDRGLGQTKPVTEEEKKQAGVADILELLAGVSTHSAAIEQGTQEAPAIEHTTIDDDQSAEAFFRELEQARQGDVDDGVLVDG